MSTTSILSTNAKDSSEASTYMKIPVILKFVGVIVAIVCVGIAAHDLVTNFEDLTARSAVVVAGHKLKFLEGAWKFTKTTVRTVFGLGNLDDVDHYFLDQMACRVFYLSISSVFLVISMIQLIWFPASLFSGPMKTRIISGVIYHLIGFALHLAASQFLLARIDLLGSHFYNAETMRSTAYLGFASAAINLLSALLALWSIMGEKSMQKKLSFEKLSKELMNSVPNFLK